MLKCSYSILEMPPRVNHESLPCSRVMISRRKPKRPRPRFAPTLTLPRM